MYGLPGLPTSSGYSTVTPGINHDIIIYAIEKAKRIFFDHYRNLVGQHSAHYNNICESELFTIDSAEIMNTVVTILLLLIL